MYFFFRTVLQQAVPQRSRTLHIVAAGLYEHGQQSQWSHRQQRRA